MNPLVQIEPHAQNLARFLADRVHEDGCRRQPRAARITDQLGLGVGQQRRGKHRKLLHLVGRGSFGLLQLDHLQARFLQHVDKTQLALGAVLGLPPAHDDGLVTGRQLIAGKAQRLFAEGTALAVERRPHISRPEPGADLGHADVHVHHRDASGISASSPGWPIIAIPSGRWLIASRNWVTILSKSQSE